ncbi:hypothetical protein E2C01_011249 [Portunus trituberculatus]|uniref:Uncharacterized protein n=1 Tax=Portunus trituberculatus TaxID=210409 RepID=A0A5B7DAX4_PORTR|nr:hypothetical protein [Portunus trituberculatus]
MLCSGAEGGHQRAKASQLGARLGYAEPERSDTYAQPATCYVHSVSGCRDGPVGTISCRAAKFAGASFIENVGAGWGGRQGGEARRQGKRAVGGISMQVTTDPAVTHFALGL